MFARVPSDPDFVRLEHEMLALWERERTFETLRAKNRGKPPWSFLDGPITANNPMGVHHAWGRTLKDCFQRFHAMLGRELRYQNGFDCQGLWVEVEVERELGFTSKRQIEAYGLERFIERCKERVRTYSAVQTKQSVRLGYWMDWDHSYYTMSDENNFAIWAFLKKCHGRGLVYRGKDAMPWCPRCGTGISEQERREGYRRVEDTALFAAFPLKGAPGQGEKLLVWTTTPWTLPANVACAVHPDLTYARVKQKGNVYLLGNDRLDVLKELGPYEVLGTFPGRDLVGREYAGPFDDWAEPGGARHAHRVIPWKEVLATEGTGIVHIAPGCGKEDFDLGKEHGLPVLAPIDEAGVYVRGYGPLTGKSAADVEEEVIQELRARGVYVKKERCAHDYPHCWRCKTKLLFRAVDEWFISMSWRDEIKEVARQIRWIPAHGLDQELDWLSNMGDWMISKKRYWGLALPIWTCPDGHFDVIGSREELRTRATAGWNAFEGHSPHRPWVDAVMISCGTCGKDARRVPDVGNPWLDAGIVPYSTVRYAADRAYWEKWIPADLVLECFPGQFRNWFYALLAMSAMMEKRPPFRTLLGHALVRDEKGEEMHKSAGNAIRFDEAAERMGVDTMRWLYARQSPSANLNFGTAPTDAVRRRVFLTWWNVYAFFANYARSDGFDPAAPQVPLARRQDIDRWILGRLDDLVRTGRERLADFDAPALVREAESFLDALSTWYVRRCRRRFWRPRDADDADKLAAYQTLHETLVTLAKALAPVVPFLTEAMYQNLARAVDPSAPPSVHLCDYPSPPARERDETLVRQMDAVLRVVSAALAVRESRQVRVRQPLREMVVVTSDETVRSAVARFEAHLLDEINLKSVVTTSDPGMRAAYEIKPNFRTLGPRLGRDLAAVGKAIAAADAGALARETAAGRDVTISDGPRTWTLTPQDLLVTTRLPGHLAMQGGPEFTVILDTTLTPELEREGCARDLIRHVQQARGAMDLDFSERIDVRYETGDPLLREAVAAHAETIKRETLCARLDAGEVLSTEPVTISGREIKLNVTRAGAAL